MREYWVVYLIRVGPNGAWTPHGEVVASNKASDVSRKARERIRRDKPGVEVGRLVSKSLRTTKVLRGKAHHCHQEV